MQQVADWLARLGLGQYARQFAENDINIGILPHLTDQDLKDLGITSVGHRRQLLLAMAELKDDGQFVFFCASGAWTVITPKSGVST